MKSSIHTKLHFVIVSIFVIGVLYSGYTLYDLPAALEKASGKIDLNIIQDAQPVLNKVYWIIGITLIIGVISLIQFLYHMNYKASGELIEATERKSEQMHADLDENVDKGADKNSAKAKEIINSSKSIKEEKDRYETILSKLCMKIEASQGVLYKVKKEKNKRYIEMLTSFAFSLPDSETLTYEFGEGLAGQVAKEGKKINIDNIPDGYVNIISGLGSASPNHLVIYPIVEGKDVVAIAEIASFKEITAADEQLISEVFKVDGVKTKPVKTESASASKKDTSKESAEDKKK